MLAEVPSTRRIATAFAGIARSLALQIVATATVTLALAAMPWHRTDVPAERPQAPPALAASPPQAAAPVTAPSFAMAEGPFDLHARAAAQSAFPLDGDETFGLSLSRPYPVLATLRRAEAGTGWADAEATRTRAATACRTCGRDAVQSVAWVRPPERPAEFASGPAQTTVGPAPAGAATHTTGWVSLPVLPTPQEIGTAVASRAEGAGAALARTTSWAGDRIAGLLRLD